MNEEMTRRLDLVSALFAVAPTPQLHEAVTEAIVEIIAGLDSGKNIRLEYVLLGLLIQEVEKRTAPVAEIIL